jgi:hypothetical protein
LPNTTKKLREQQHGPPPAPAAVAAADGWQQARLPGNQPPQEQLASSQESSAASAAATRTREEHGCTGGMESQVMEPNVRLPCYPCCTGSACRHPCYVPGGQVAVCAVTQTSVAAGELEAEGGSCLTLTPRGQSVPALTLVAGGSGAVTHSPEGVESVAQQQQRQLQAPAAATLGRGL